MSRAWEAGNAPAPTTLGGMGFKNSVKPTALVLSKGGRKFDVKAPFFLAKTPLIASAMADLPMRTSFTYSGK